jgi:hypothetical protein
MKEYTANPRKAASFCLKVGQAPLRRPCRPCLDLEASKLRFIKRSGDGNGRLPNGELIVKTPPLSQANDGVGILQRADELSRKRRINGTKMDRLAKRCVI